MFHDTWGYRSWQVRENAPAMIREKIRELAFVTARGGNYVMNFGPKGDGSIIEFEAEVIRGVGRWVHAHSDAIFDARPEPYLALDFGYATSRPGQLFLFVKDVPADGVLAFPDGKQQRRRPTFLPIRVTTSWPVASPTACSRSNSLGKR